MRNDCLIAHRFLSQLYLYVAVERQVEIYPRTELDEAQMLIHIAFLTLLGLGDHA